MPRVKLLHKIILSEAELRNRGFRLGSQARKS
jgi:hypothetical protein